MTESPLNPVLPPIAQSSNLLHYRALFQVFTYARAKKQSAEHLVRDAMTGGVVVPFSLQCSTEPNSASFVLASPQPTFPTTAAAAASEQGHCHVLLLPSSKSLATLATLLADGFFNVAPLSSTAEHVRGVSFHYRSECEVRDFFSLIILLYPDCLVAEALPRTLLALRRAESTAASTATPPAPFSIVSAMRAVSPSNSLPVNQYLEDDDAAAEPSRSPPPSPTRSAMSELVLGAAHFANTALPEVDPVPVTMADMSDLLECRRSLATVLLSSFNEALHDVQYRELERARTTTRQEKVAASPSQCTSAMPTSGEAAALQTTSEALLTAKLLLMSVMAASEVWRQRAQRQKNNGAPSQLPSPYLVLYELLDADDATAAEFTTLPVEEWGWGKGREATEQWYDRTLGRLLQSTEAAGVSLEAFLQSSKSFAARQGRAISSAPTLLFHRPSDGCPAVEFHLSFMESLNAAVALPVMPLQPGEVQLLLHPCVVRRAARKGGVTVSSRGHELLLDSSASPTADFLQRCASSAFPSTMLQEPGGGLPAHFKHRFYELSASERSMIQSFLDDPQLLTAFLDKNAPMLARLTIWCDGQWPTRRAVACGSSDAEEKEKEEGESAFGGESAAGRRAAGRGGDELAAGVKEAVMFRRPFNVAVGRYVREMVMLKGFDQETLERWVRHICTDVAQDGPFAAHRSTLSALVKFAALQSKWTWSSEIADLLKQHLW